MSLSIEDFLENVRNQVREKGKDGKLDKFCINELERLYFYTFKLLNDFIKRK